jgi:hypothetical protein
LSVRKIVILIVVVIAFYGFLKPWQPIPPPQVDMPLLPDFADSKTENYQGMQNCINLAICWSGRKHDMLDTNPPMFRGAALYRELHTSYYQSWIPGLVKRPRWKLLANNIAVSGMLLEKSFSLNAWKNLKKDSLPPKPPVSARLKQRELESEARLKVADPEGWEWQHCTDRNGFAIDTPGCNPCKDHTKMCLDGRKFMVSEDEVKKIQEQNRVRFYRENGIELNGIEMMKVNP